MLCSVKEHVVNKLVIAPSLGNPAPNMQQVKEIRHDSIAGECKVIRLAGLARIRQKVSRTESSRRGIESKNLTESW